MCKKNIKAFPRPSLTDQGGRTRLLSYSYSSYICINNFLHAFTVHVMDSAWGACVQTLGRVLKGIECMHAVAWEGACFFFPIEYLHPSISLYSNWRTLSNQSRTIGHFIVSLLLDLKYVKMFVSEPPDDFGTSVWLPPFIRWNLPVFKGCITFSAMTARDWTSHLRVLSCI